MTYNIGGSLSYSSAVSRLKGGSDVWSKSSNLAFKVAQGAGKGKDQQIMKDIVNKVIIGIIIHGIEVVDIHSSIFKLKER